MQQIIGANEIAPNPNRPACGVTSIAKFSWISSMISNTSRDSRSILLQKVRIGRSRRRQTSNSFCVWLSNAFGPVNHHDRGIHRCQGAVGVFGKVTVAGGVHQIEAIRAEIKGHRTGRNGNAAIRFDFHEVRAGAPRLALGAHLTRHLNGTAKQQEFFGQVVLPASGCEMIAKVRRRRAISGGKGDMFGDMFVMATE
jgi:hypothetical protein